MAPFSPYYTLLRVYVNGARTVRVFLLTRIVFSYTGVFSSFTGIVSSLRAFSLHCGHCLLIDAHHLLGPAQCRPNVDIHCQAWGMQVSTATRYLSERLDAFRDNKTCHIW